jgi:tetratricopeptide (TPR) repeat protein
MEDKEKVDYLIEEAQSLLQNGHYREAAAAYRLILDMDPTNEKAISGLASAEGQIESVTAQEDGQLEELAEEEGDSPDFDPNATVVFQPGEEASADQVEVSEDQEQPFGEPEPPPEEQEQPFGEPEPPPAQQEPNYDLNLPEMDRSGEAKGDAGLEDIASSGDDAFAGFPDIQVTSNETAKKEETEEPLPPPPQESSQRGDAELEDIVMPSGAIGLGSLDGSESETGQAGDPDFPAPPMDDSVEDLPLPGDISVPDTVDDGIPQPKDEKTLLSLSDDLPGGEGLDEFDLPMGGGPELSSSTLDEGPEDLPLPSPGDDFDPLPAPGPSLDDSAGEGTSRSLEESFFGEESVPTVAPVDDVVERRGAETSSMALFVIIALIVVGVGGGGTALWLLKGKIFGSGEGDKPTPVEVVTSDPVAPDPIAQKPEKIDREKLHKKVELWIDQAVSAYDEKDYEKAKILIENAREKEPDNPRLATHYEEIIITYERNEECVMRLKKAKEAFYDEDYIAAMPLFENMERDCKEHLEIANEFITKIWYNAGVHALQAGKMSDSIYYFNELLIRKPDDQEGMKLRKYAKKYSDRVLDYNYFQFVDSLKPRF